MNLVKGFNWGHGIFIFYVLFVGVLVTALVASFGVDHTLVVDDYYAKDLAYQEQFDKTSRSNQADNLSIQHTAGGEEVTLHFEASSELAGKVMLYRPSDSSLDLTLDISSADMVIPTTDLLDGRWLLKVDWQDGAETFYREVDLYL